jgi:SAM-dependent methyltransferase
MKRHVEVFQRDAETHAGYLYTTNLRLSSRMATGRSTELVLATGELAGKRVLDMGCGDGFYTLRYWDRARPSELVAVDGAHGAVRLALERSEGRAIRCSVADVHQLPFRDRRFDVVLLQSVLHHDDSPERTVREAFRLAPRLVIHEPNGYNLGLKIIERTSRYHIEHAERSYTSRRIARWVAAAGGRVVSERMAGFVAMFSPDWLAKVMKSVEPLVESTPVVRRLACAVCVLVAQRE